MPNMKSILVALMGALSLSACSADGTSFDPSRDVRVNLSAPADTEPGVVLYAFVSEQACAAIRDQPIRSASSVVGDIDVDDPEDRTYVVTWPEPTTMRCLTLLPLDLPSGLSPESPEATLAAGLDTLHLDVDLRIGLDADPTPYMVEAQF